PHYTQKQPNNKQKLISYCHREKNKISSKISSTSYFEKDYFRYKHNQKKQNVIKKQTSNKKKLW
ncbi:hypothetical protein, partial [Klebsiella pneumoniae]|uniref:hypothetical protein n=1 Tax=Klebsiella pneumoniae TaxID=573 RepID=UPI0027318791